MTSYDPTGSPADALLTTLAGPTLAQGGEASWQPPTHTQPTASALSLSERLVVGSVLSGRSVWLSAGGGLTLFVAVDQLGLTDFGCVARHRPRTAGVT